MIAADCHVHIYKGFDLDLFFREAFKNFRFALGGIAAIKALVLTEKSGSDFFTSAKNNFTCSSYSLQVLEEGRILKVIEKATDDFLFVAPGFQMATKERIEIHGLFTKERISDNLSADETINKIKDMGGIPLVPWSLGKWTGRRKKIVFDIVEKYRESIILGDSALRPKVFLDPVIFNHSRPKGIRVLAGSDPLPVKGGETQVARLFNLFFSGVRNDDLYVSLREAVSSVECRYIIKGEHLGLLPVIFNNIKLKVPSARVA